MIDLSELAERLAELFSLQVRIGWTIAYTLRDELEDLKAELGEQYNEKAILEQLGGALSKSWKTLYNYVNIARKPWAELAQELELTIGHGDAVLGLEDTVAEDLLRQAAEQQISETHLRSIVWVRNNVPGSGNGNSTPILQQELQGNTREYESSVPVLEVGEEDVIPFVDGPMYDDYEEEEDAPTGGYWLHPDGTPIDDIERMLNQEGIYYIPPQEKSLPLAAANHVVSADPDYDGDEWYTPAEYIEAAREVMGGIDLDPASCSAAQEEVQATAYYTKEDDALRDEVAWLGRVWLNPPYSRIIDSFVDKLIEQYEAGFVTEAIVLTNNSTDTGWFHELISRYPACLTRGRIPFWRPGLEVFSTRQGQVFFYLGLNPAKFGDVFSRFGQVVTRL
jgi:phage N-6-adenine-methyltransferase